MKLNIGKLLKTVARAAKDNPEIALGVVGLIAPKVVKRIAPIVVAAAVRR
ncbi:hypothetical protein [Sphingomonas sp. ABOLF]|nr:hypothetical protein [Sphingomonas sp. ABOLF]